MLSIYGKDLSHIYMKIFPGLTVYLGGLRGFSLQRLTAGGR